MGAQVLVAEDNDDYRTVLRMLLTSIGCTVVEASNGIEAIEKAASTHPNLIIMDLLMPQLGGLEATKRLKRI
jgi:CheY-like chemotaxis protein